MRVSGRQVRYPRNFFVWYFLIKLMPMLISGLGIYLGYRLFILGVTGQASLSFESTTIHGRLLNAAPGVFLAVGGFATLIAAVLKGVTANLAGGDGDLIGVAVAEATELRRHDVML
jgi:uncharacterized membrane protein